MNPAVFDAVVMLVFEAPVGVALGRGVGVADGRGAVVAVAVGGCTVTCAVALEVMYPFLAAVAVMVHVVA